MANFKLWRMLSAFILSKLIDNSYVSDVVNNIIPILAFQQLPLHSEGSPRATTRAYCVLWLIQNSKHARFFPLFLNIQKSWETVKMLILNAKCILSERIW